MRVFTLSLGVEPGLDQRKNKRTSMPTYPPLGPPTSNLIDAASSFLSVRPGQFVIVRELTHASERVDIEKNWWLGQVIFCEGWEKHSRLHSLFQVADVDDGAIRWVHPTQVTHVLHGLDGIGQEGWDGFED
ncbi:DUF3104 domain-containing protein [Synechococcus sp. GEYO]|nr:DUF3104 domain-containing protein [Synechococcus sp. GEYO]